VRNPITLAYSLRDFQLVGGPGWINTEGYDVVAKASSDEVAAAPGDPQPNGESIDQRRLRFDRVRERLRWLLADRFGLVVHHETRDQPVYLLTLAKNGPKLKAVPAPDGPPRKEEGRGHAQGFAAPLDMLVATLSNATHRTVVDKTGLTGRYDFVLDWTPDFQGAPADSSLGRRFSLPCRSNSDFVWNRERLPWIWWSSITWTGLRRIKGNQITLGTLTDHRTAACRFENCGMQVRNVV
jgi:uncharacterized protein (TIGR03435 family)